jgi:hypothetical protein
MSKKYNYIIARFWDKDEYPTEKERLCIYTIHNREVHFGTEEEAFNMAERIRRIKNREYKPYFIDLKQNLVKIEEL